MYRNSASRSVPAAAHPVAVRSDLLFAPMTGIGALRFACYLETFKRIRAEDKLIASTRFEMALFV